VVLRLMRADTVSSLKYHQEHNHDFEQQGAIERTRRRGFQIAPRIQFASNDEWHPASK
jgi:hypothetical protein